MTDLDTCLAGLGSAPQSRWAAPPTAFQKLSDRFNPLVVRDVSLVANSRIVRWSVALAFVGGFAFVLYAYRLKRLAPLDFMVGGAALGTFVVTFLLPLWVFQHFRNEVKRERIEQLLLTVVTPDSIVAGHLQLAVLLRVALLLLVAPWIALTVALSIGSATEQQVVHGTVAMLGLWCVSSIVLDIVAVAAAALSVFWVFRPLCTAGLVIVVAGVTTLVTEFVETGFLPTGETALGWLAANWSEALEPAMMLLFSTWIALFVAYGAVVCMPPGRRTL